MVETILATEGFYPTLYCVLYFFKHICPIICFYFLCLVAILFEGTSVAFISLWRYTVLLPVIRWLPEDGDGSQVYHCVYLWDEASASVSWLKKIQRSVSFGWNKIIFFWLMAFEIAFPWPLAWFFSFLYRGRHNNFVEIAGIRGITR